MPLSAVVLALIVLAVAPAAAAASHVPLPADCGTPGVILGTPGADRALRGTPGPDVICGLGGDDVIYGLGGHDVLVGGDGADLLFGGRGGDVFDGGAGTDHASYNDSRAGVTVTIGDAVPDGTGGGAEGDDVQASVERVTGTAFVDSLTGDGGTDDLRGAGGEDELDGGPGDDVLTGGTAADVLRGGAGSDLADYRAATAPVRVSIGGGANDGADGGAEGDDVGTDVERLRGGAGADKLYGNQRSNTLYGGPGADLLMGGEANDTFFGGAGPDVFNGGAGTGDRVSYVDTLGSVKVSLGVGADDGFQSMPGPTGITEGDDVQATIERVSGTAFADLFFSGVEGAWFDGNGGQDSLIGTPGDDMLIGDNGLLAGLGQADHIDAGGGVDYVAGGAGDDRITARDGAFDVVDCGADHDIFEADLTDDYDADCDDGLPTPLDDTVTALPDTPLDIDVLANDFDLRLGTLEVVDVTQPYIGEGTTTFTAGGVTYTPPSGYVGGPVQFTYYVSDGINQGTAQVFLDVNAPPAIDTTAIPMDYLESEDLTEVDGGLEISDADDAELDGATVRITGNYAGAQDVLGTICECVDDYGLTESVSGDTLTITGTAAVSAYAEVLQSVGYRNTSDEPSAAQRTVTFTVDDGDDTASDSVPVNIQLVNDLPTDLVLDGGTVAENGGAGATVGTFTTIDPDHSPVTYTVDDPALAFDGATLKAVGNLDFEAKSSHPVTVKSTDADGNYYDEPFTIAVTDVNEAPVLAGLETAALEVSPGETKAVTSALTVADPDAGEGMASATVSIAEGREAGDTLAFTDPDGRIEAQYSAGTLTLTGGGTPARYEEALRSVTFTPAAGARESTRKLTFAVSDGALGSNVVERDVEVSVYNAPPVAATDTYGDAENPATVGNVPLYVGRPAENEVPNFPRTGSVLANDSDPEGTALTASNAVASAGAQVTLHADGSFEYVPAPGDEGKDSFTYTVTDAAGETATGTAEVWIDTQAVWFVKDSGTGDGTYADPFGNVDYADDDALDGADGAGDVDRPGDTIALLNSGGVIAYNRSLRLEAGQTLTGAAAGLPVDPAGSVPARQLLFATGQPTQLSSTDPGPAVRLAEGSAVRGIDILRGDNAISAVDIDSATVADCDVSMSGGAALLVDGGDGEIVVSGGTITAPGGGVGVRVQDRTGGSVTIGSAVTAGVIRATNNDAGHAVNLTGRVKLDLTDGAGAALVVLNGGALTLSNPASTITTPGGATAALVRGGGGDVTVAASLSSGPGPLAVVEERTGGDVRFDGTAKAGGSVGLAANTGGTVRFRNGGLTATSFTATGGGSVEVSGTGNTLSGGLSVVGPDLAAQGLAFADVDATGGANGIKLSDTGSAGGLTVAGGTIENTTGDAVSLARTHDVALDGLTISGAAGHGLRATDVTGTFALTDSTIEEPATGGISLRNATGTLDDLQVTGNTIRSATSAAASSGDGIEVVMAGNAGAAGRLVDGAISGNTVRNFPSGAGIRIATDQTATVTPAVQPWIGGYFTTDDKLVVSGNLVSGESAGNRMGRAGIAGRFQGNGQVNVEVTGNGTAADPVGNTKGEGIGVDVLGAGRTKVIVDGNHVVPNNQPGIDGAGISVLTGFATFADAGTTNNPRLRAQVTGNTVSGAADNGVLVGDSGTHAETAARVSGNTVSAPVVNSGSGIQVMNGPSGPLGSGFPSMCLEIAENVTAGTAGRAGIHLVQGAQTRNGWPPFQFAAMGGAQLLQTDAASASAFVSAANPGSQEASSQGNARATVSDTNALFRSSSCQLGF